MAIDLTLGAAASRRRACILLLTLVLAACGGGDEEEAAAPPTTASTLATTTVTKTTTVTTAEAEPALTGPTFQLPSRNIGCAFAEDVLRCDILSGLVPEPGEPCELDWVGIVFGEHHAAAPQCAGDTVYDQEAPTLAYGQSWARGGLRCESRRTGLSCANEDGRSFTLARAGWTAS